MRRIKEGFYGIMKISNQIKEKPEYKEQIIEHSKTKIEKPLTDVALLNQKPV